MNVRDIVDKNAIGTHIYVVKPMRISWGSMRFENTNIVYATYVVVESGGTPGLWGTNVSPILKPVDLPEGTKKFPTFLNRNDDEYQCFLTPEEAEIWKVIELQDLEDKVVKHIELMKDKTKRKIKKLKQKERLDDYFQKYPEKFLKVM